MMTGTPTSSPARPATSAKARRTSGGFFTPRETGPPSRSVAVEPSHGLTSTGQPQMVAMRTAAEGVVATPWRITGTP